MMKAMLPDELLADANGAFQSIREGLRLVAPLAGAGIYAAFGGPVVALVDAGTFLALGRHARRAAFPGAAAGAEGAPLSARAVRGSHPHRETPVLRQLSIGVGAALLATASTRRSSSPSTARASIGRPSFIGVLMSFQGVGAVVGGLTAARLLKRSATCGSRESASSSSACRRLSARAARRRVLAAPRSRRRRAGLGGRRDRDRLSAAQPEPPARSGVRSCEHAVQRAADDLDRTRSSAHHPDRLPGRDRDR